MLTSKVECLEGLSRGILLPLFRDANWLKKKKNHQIFYLEKKIIEKKKEKSGSVNYSHCIVISLTENT